MGATESRSPPAPQRAPVLSRQQHFTTTTNLSRVQYSSVQSSVKQHHPVLQTEVTQVIISSSPLDFPFLLDDGTKEYVTGSKVMFILRGLPGSGKSTLVKELLKKYPQGVVCSADHYLVQKGEYVWTPERVKVAHEKCQDRARDACLSNVHVIIVDNTNVTAWEINHYTQMASAFDYVPVVVETKTPWCFDANVLVQKTTHKVSLEIMKAKLSKWRDIIPVYYGWFLNQSDSKVLCALAYSFLLECLTIDAFSFDLMQYVENIEDIPGHFYVPEVSTLRHCTSFFSAKGKVEGSEDYHRKVRDYVGKQYELNIIGFVITPRTYGAWVQITDDQTKLWNQKDAIKPTGDPENLQPNANVQKKPFHNVGSAAPNKKMKFSASGESSCIPSLLWHDNNSVSCSVDGSVVAQRAHITLGVAQGVKPVQTGYDLLEVIRLNRFGNQGKNYNVYNGSLKNLGNGQWVILLNKALRVSSLFSGFYN